MRMYVETVKRGRFIVSDGGGSNHPRSWWLDPDVKTVVDLEDGLVIKQTFGEKKAKLSENELMLITAGCEEFPHIGDVKCGLN